MIFVVLALAFSGLFLDFLQNVISRLGLNLRLIEAIEDDTFADDSVRQRFYSTALELIGERPITGYGLTGESFYLGGTKYVHNLFLELWVAFGVVFGSGLIVSAIWITVKGWLSMKQFSPEWIMCVSLVVYNYVMLMVSGSFLRTGTMFLLLGLCIAMIRRKKESEDSLKNRQKFLRRKYTYSE